jgi:hypothetical protein
MSAMRPFVVRFSPEELDRYRVQARTERKPLATWLRDVLAWYLEVWLPTHRQVAGGEAIDDQTHLATITPTRRLGLPKRLLDQVALAPGDRVTVTVRGNELVVGRPAGMAKEATIR